MASEHPCPGCGRMFSRDEWEPKLFSGTVHVDVRVRRRELRQLNLSRRDFAAGPEGQKRYDDYLEMTEDFAYSLANGENTEQTRRAIQEFVQEHTDLIRRNTARLIDERKNEREQREEAAAIRAGVATKGGILSRLSAEEEKKRMENVQRREKFLDSLASSNNASAELAKFQMEEAARNAREEGPKATRMTNVSANPRQLCLFPAQSAPPGRPTLSAGNTTGIA